MRIAVVSDIHGNLPALEAVVADFARAAVDAVVNLGDALSGPLLPLETASYLMQTDWVHLAGNHERQLLTDPIEAQGPSDRYARLALGPTELSWVEGLLPTHMFDQHVLLCHGSPRSDLEYLLETVEAAQFRAATRAEIAQRLGRVSAELILCGHSHVARSVRADTGQLIVNPGSVGQPGYDDHEPYVHYVDSGSPDARYAIVERHHGRWTVSLRTVPYNYWPMVQLARARQREDWAVPLATGFALRALTA